METVVFYSYNEYSSYIQDVLELPTEFVVSAYLVKDKEVCLIDHIDIGKWLPPGGHILEREDPITALKREILDETGWQTDFASHEKLYCEPEIVWQIPCPRFIQYEKIVETGNPIHIHINLVYFCLAKERIQEPDLLEGQIRWFEMNDLDELERIFPHTRMNAIAAIREIGAIVPNRLMPEKDRVLVPIGGRCPYRCVYCYTKRHDVYFGEPDPQKVFNLLEKACKESEKTLTAQVGYDNDPFIDPQLGLDILTKLAWLPLHVGFSTKAFISEETARRISIIRALKNSEGFNLSALVTLTCLESSSILEPNAPSPQERLKTIKNLANLGVPVLINLRPILPDDVPEKEFYEIIQLSKDAGAIGIVFGAFWVDPDGIVLKGLRNPTISSSEQLIPWSPHGLNWKRYENIELVRKLTSYTKDLGMEAFESSADAVKYVNSLF